MSWDSIVGQERVKTLLKGALGSRKLPHAYLFHGPEGVGKDAMAIELAKVLNCEVGGDSACDRCESCLRFATLQHPNLILVFPLPVGKGEKSGDLPLAKLSQEDLDNIREQTRLKAENRYHAISIPKATTIKVNSIRDIKREAALTTYRTGKKVILVLDAEYMNAESSNALLKTLEEPREDTMLILTTAHKDQLLTTVASRCQTVRFDVLSEKEISHFLQQRRAASSSQAELVARLAHGSISRADGLLEVDLQEPRERVVEYLRVLHNGDEAEIGSFLETLAREYDRNQMEQFLHILQFWLRDALCLHEDYAAIVNVDYRDSIRKFAERFPEFDYHGTVLGVDNAVSLLNKNVYIPLILMTLSLSIRESLTRHVH